MDETGPVPPAEERTETAVPPPPPEAPGPAAAEPADRFRTVVAVLIAVTSILGAVVAWRASVSSSDAGDLDEQATQELVLQEQELASIEGLVANDQRLFARYQEHILAWRILLRQADETRQSDVGLADALKAQAAGELALARSLRRFFQGGTPDFGDEEGKVVYDREFVMNNLRANNPELAELDPDATFALAEEEHDRTVRLVGVFTLVIVALFFLTIAQFAREAIRGLFAVAGVVVALAGLVLFALVEGRVV